MTLIKSISGIRGTIGGMPDEGLTPLDIVKFTSAFGAWIKKRANKKEVSIVIGRDARISGEMVQHLVVGTLQGLGINVIDLGLSTTPTVEVAVTMENASGGIILTASHNPKQWNALKLLNEKGEFISATDGEEVLRMAAANEFEYANVDELGTYSVDNTYLDKHIHAVIDLPLVDVAAIKAKNFTVAIDCVNSTGGIFLPPLLKALGVKEVIELFCDPNGIFPHNPEPLPENLTEIASVMKKQQADVGFVVDPDVDRLAIVSEDGEMFGEEYTLVAVADYVLQNQKGNTVSNLSSTKALRDVTEKQGGVYFASAVGEVNVVEMMKKENAIIGGEGNGGIIYPELHYGRDALVGIALFLTHLAKSNITCSELRNSYPNYVMSKNKIELTPDINVDELLIQLQQKYTDKEINTIDGVKIHFDNGWVHLRKSNTEPIIRIYAENTTKEKADELAQQIIKDVEGMVRLV
ncbi:MAG: phosphoglucosamine mutase [Flavobacteriales bacterium]|nr:phosphoglucosamine mutase [Flavobacteriales bacterium]MCW8912739.1 phosphoglucosamine mutase [Flavobacteriales bacterium]MCW8936850.1 phosphoglucosamine mutase [Flavobacteriales bacterium]MCW8940565.1 phosphoglucosamine mutase [Flavobacteriales bacterium]MCW8968093.1 phosphoglucosamine mutase [Flavobacteriales bacterium]